MKIGVISDIHANLQALSVVIQELYDCDEIICLGDVCSFGPQVNECFDLLKSIPNLSLLKGNHDAYSNLFYSHELVNFFPKELEDYLKEVSSNVSHKHHIDIENLPYSMERVIEGKRLSFVHFPWKNPLETLSVGELPLDESFINSTFKDFYGDLIVYGHTHYSHDLTIEKDGEKTRHINFGAVGVPHDFGDYARFGTIEVFPNREIKIDFKKEKYNVEKTISKIRENKHPYNTLVLNKFFNR